MKSGLVNKILGDLPTAPTGLFFVAEPPTCQRTSVLGGVYFDSKMMGGEILKVLMTWPVRGSSKLGGKDVTQTGASVRYKGTYGCGSVIK